MPTFSFDAELPASAPRVWKALKDAPTIIPKVAPQAVASMENIEGKDEEIGGVRLIKLGSGGSSVESYLSSSVLCPCRHPFSFSRSKGDCLSVVQYLDKISM